MFVEPTYIEISHCKVEARVLVKCVKGVRATKI